MRAVGGQRQLLAGVSVTRVAGGHADAGGDRHGGALVDDAAGSDRSAGRSTLRSTCPRTAATATSAASPAGVAVAIIQRLEMVQVDHDQRERVPGAAGPVGLLGSGSRA